MFVGLNMSGSAERFTTKERRFLGDIEILDEHLIAEYGCIKRVKRWLRGMHPSLGKIHKGYTGIETIQDIDVFVPSHSFHIAD